MNTSRFMKLTGWASAVAIATSLVVLLVAACLFGFRFTHWTEWQGGTVGVVGTFAGVAGALIGLRVALRAERRAMQSRGPIRCV